MGDIDKAVELAREHMADRADCVCDYPTCVLARAVLAMAAVVEQARIIRRGFYSTKVALTREDRIKFDNLYQVVEALDAEARRG